MHYRQNQSTVKVDFCIQSSFCFQISLPLLHIQLITINLIDVISIVFICDSTLNDNESEKLALGGNFIELFY